MKIKETIALLALWPLAGCLTPGGEPPPRPNYYDLQVEAQHENREQAEVLPVQLGIRSFSTLGPYGAGMVYRKTSNRIAVDNANQWIMPPDQLITRRIYLALAESGTFSTVYPPDSIRDPERELTGTLVALEVTPDLDAVLELEIRLMNGRTGKLLMTRRYRAEQQLKTKSADAFAAATAAGLEEIIIRLISDIRKQTGE